MNSVALPCCGTAPCWCRITLLLAMWCKEPSIWFLPVQSYFLNFTIMDILKCMWIKLVYHFCQKEVPSNIIKLCCLAISSSLWKGKEKATYISLSKASLSRKEAWSNVSIFSIRNGALKALTSVVFPRTGNCSTTLILSKEQQVCLPQRNAKKTQLYPS